MSNLSQNIIPESQSLSFSSSSSSHHPNYQRLSDSLQYLDRIRKINLTLPHLNNNPPLPQNYTNQSYPQTASKTILSPLQKLINTNQQITYIDNQKIFAIINVDQFNKLKQRLAQLQSHFQNIKASQHQLKVQNNIMKIQLQKYSQLQTSWQNNLNLLTQSLQEQKHLKKVAEQQLISLTDSLLALTKERAQDSQKYLALKNQFDNFKNENNSFNRISSRMICETQTEAFITTINIPPFQVNLEEILQQLKSKQSQKISHSDLKEVIAKSLDSFVKQLDVQYNLIQQQSIDLTQLRNKNKVLEEENVMLKRRLEQIEIEQQKLKIFKSCMTEFLQDTSQNLSKSIQSQRSTQKSMSQVSADKNKQLAYEQIQVSDNVRVKELKENMESLRRQNMSLIKTIGEYQYKWKNVEKVLQEKTKEDIPDDGTVGQLVKMSKLVKESIKNLLHQL